MPAAAQSCALSIRIGNDYALDCTTSNHHDLLSGKSEVLYEPGGTSSTPMNVCNMFVGSVCIVTHLGSRHPDHRQRAAWRPGTSTRRAGGGSTRADQGVLCSHTAPSSSPRTPSTSGDGPCACSHHNRMSVSLQLCSDFGFCCCTLQCNCGSLQQPPDDSCRCSTWPAVSSSVSSLIIEHADLI